MACYKDIVVAAVYSKIFSESDQSTYQERQQSLVILITQERGYINYISTDFSAEKMRIHNDSQNSG